jgi:hypothetical protein
MFNVLGGCGQVNPTANNNSSTFSRSIVNILGPRVTLASGGVSYSPLRTPHTSYWFYNHTENKGFVNFAGTACGIAAAFLWLPEGIMIMSLPLKKCEGK